MPAMTDNWQPRPPQRTVHDGPGWYRLAGFVRAALVISALVYAVDVAGSWWAAQRLSDWLDDPTTVSLTDARRIDDLNQTTAVSELALLLVTGVLFVCWLYQAYNRPQADESAVMVQRGWAIGGWIVPVANFVLPYRVVQGLNRTTARPPRADSSLVIAWWATWVTFSGLGLVERAVAPDSTHDHGLALIRDLHTADLWASIAAVPGVVAAVLAVLVVTQLTERFREVAGTGVNA
jgi:hypothetical protein